MNRDRAIKIAAMHKARKEYDEALAQCVPDVAIFLSLPGFVSNLFEDVWVKFCKHETIDKITERCKRLTTALINRYLD